MKWLLLWGSGIQRSQRERAACERKECHQCSKQHHHEIEQQLWVKTEENHS